LVLGDQKKNMWSPVELNMGEILGSRMMMRRMMMHPSLRKLILILCTSKTIMTIDDNRCTDTEKQAGRIN